MEKGEESGLGRSLEVEVVAVCPWGTIAMSNTAKMVKQGIIEYRILESNCGACVV